jgi:TolA-binding protein
MRRDDDAVSEPKTRSERNQSQAKATPSVSAETKTQRQRELEADSADSTPRARVAAAPESKPAAAAAAPPVSGTMAKPASPAADAMQGYVDLPPEKWLERIADLRKQGRIEEAKASFIAFRKRYPEYPLPATLKDWTNP